MNKETAYLSPWLIICIAIIISLSLTACNRHKPCNPETKEGCPSSTVCEATGPGQGLCLEVCDPASENACGFDEVCFQYADGNYACTPKCNPEARTCPDGWLCAPVAEGEFVCRPGCDEGSINCDPGEVCQPLFDGTAVCTAQCDPREDTACGEQWVCEMRTDGQYACAEPVYVRGKVFDSADAHPIEDAHVIAVDTTGAAATDVAISNAEGFYELQVPVERNPDGTLYEGTFTLRVAAADYMPYPFGIRPAIPVDATQASHDDEGMWVLQNAATEVALILLPPEKQGLGSISGNIVTNTEDAGPGGVLVTVEGGAEQAPIGFSDKSGKYTVFNVPPGNWEVYGYKAFLQLDPAPVPMVTGEIKTDVNLIQNTKPYGTVTGSINIVNAPGGSATSVVFVPESTFNETFVKGEVPPGLRAPAPPESPSITGSFTIDGVPDGKYVVLAAFENDLLVRDPDPNIAGTKIEHIQVPEGTSYQVSMPVSFKVTEALTIVSPGATEPEPISGTPAFIWRDDSSETKYSIVVYNAFGVEVWRDDNLPRVTGSENVTVNYAGSSLQPGMYYQFRATSWRNTGPISQTEDLLGVFYIPSSSQ